MPEENKKYEFGGFLLETKDKILFQADEVVRIPPKAGELLAYFIENSGRVLSKDELMENVWKDTFVEEANLTQHISTLRKVLGKDFIQTIPRKGYRFIAEVNVGNVNKLEISASENQTTKAVQEIEPKNQTAQPLTDNLSFPTFSYLKIFSALALLAGVCFVIVYFWFWQKPQVNSIAVLPFKTLATDENDDYLKFGMADALITKLGVLKKITVRPTSSILRYTDTTQDSVTAGKELNVDAVLEGAVQRNKDRFKISIQLIRTSNGAIIWAETFDESSANILNLQDSISEKIVTSLSLNLTGDEKKSLAKRHTENPEAYQLYLQGRFHWYKWSPEGFQKAIEYFQKAIEKDPNYAPAYAGLGDAYGALGLTSSSKESYLKSKEATLKALEIDDSLAEAHITLGMLKLFYEWNGNAAHEQLLTALKLSPNNALAHDCYAIYLMNVGQTNESIFHARRAQELDPLSPYMNGDLGMAYYQARQFDTALVHLNKALELDPNYIDALEYQAEIYLLKGQHAQAVELWKKVLIINGESPAAESLAQTFATFGYQATVEKRIEQLKERAKQNYVSPLELANNYARLGDKRQMMEWLARAYQEKIPFLLRVKIEPRWDNFRSDAEFQELMQKINLGQ